MKKVTIAILALAFGLAAHADTLNFLSTGSNVAGSDYAYPYFFSINSSTTLTPLMCLSYDNEITTGESWEATLSNPTTVLEKEASWLLLDAIDNPSNVSDDQLAAWSLLASDVPMNAGATTQLSLAEAGYESINPNNFVLYTPVDGTQSIGGIPQTFIGETPEPFSLLLFGSGMAGLAFLMRRGYAK